MLENELTEIIKKQLSSMRESLEYQIEAQCETLASIKTLQHLLYLFIKKDS